MGNSRLSPEVRQALMAELKTQHQSGLTDQEIADKLGVARRTLTPYKHKLLAELNSQIKIQQRAKLKRTTPGAAIKDIALRADPYSPTLPSTGILSPSESMRLLTALAKDSLPAVQVQALKALEDLRAIHTPAESAGPPPPMTDDEKVARLARLMDAVGPTIARRASEVAFPITEVPNETPDPS